MTYPVRHDPSPFVSSKSNDTVIFLYRQGESYTWPPAQGIGGARSVLCAARKEWSEAEPRKARFPARSAGNAPKQAGNHGA
jgi:hypothetical protein